MKGTSTGYALGAGAISLVVGLALHVLATYLRDDGPSWESLSLSLRGNGALVVLIPAMIALVLGELLCVRRRAWLGTLLVPLGLYVGLFVVLGSF